VTSFLKIRIERIVCIVDLEAPTMTLVRGLVYLISIKVAVEAQNNILSVTESAKKNRRNFTARAK
jgi:hypothetical protein